MTQPHMQTVLVCYADVYSHDGFTHEGFTGHVVASMQLLPSRSPQSNDT